VGSGKRYRPHMNAPDSSVTEKDATRRALESTFEAIAYTGLSPDAIAGALVVGGATVELLIAIDRLLPRRPILILDTLDALMDLERRAENGLIGAELAARCTTVVLGAPASPFSLQAYLASWDFLLAQDIAPDAVALCGNAHDSGDELLTGAYAAAADLLIGHSSQFIARVERGRLPIQQVVEWAMFLAQRGALFHALKLLYVLSQAAPRTSLAPTIVELWVALGCPEPALDWLDDLAPSQRQSCEAALRHAAAVRRQALSETLEENRAELAQRSMSLPEAVGGERTVHVVLLPSVPWLPAPGGGARRERYPCSFRIQDGQIVELSPPRHPRPLFEMLRKPRRAHDAVALLGSMASPTLFQVIAELQPATGLPDWKQRVYVLEEDPDVIHAFLSTLSLAHPLEQERFDFVLGPGAAAELERRMRDNPMLPLPDIAAEARRDQVDALTRVRDHREARAKELIVLLAERYTPERLAELPELLGPAASRPLRVLIYTSFFTTVLKYQARDMAAGFERLGHQAQVLHEGQPTHLMTTHAILETVASFDPDLFYCLDQIRPGVTGLPPRLPFVCWIQDELPRLSRRDWITQLGPGDFTFCLSAEWTRRYRELGYPHTAQLSMAADPDVYAPPGEDTPATAAAAVVLITHVSPPTEAFPGLFARLEPALRAEIKMRPTVLEYDPEITAAAAAAGMQLDAAQLDEARQSAHRLARHLELTTAARWLAEAGFDLGLYGNGWSDIPDLARYARGVLKPGRDLAAVYSAAKVVLQINGTMNCHVRVFECLASGGLPLCRSHATDYEPGELDAALRIGQEVLCFDGRDDLIATVRRLIDDDAYRQSITLAGRRRVLGEHSMQHRMQRTLDEIRRELSEREAHSGLRARDAAPAEPRRSAAALP
jgi:glycosyl transferase family 1